MTFDLTSFANLLGEKLEAIKCALQDAPAKLELLGFALEKTVRDFERRERRLQRHANCRSRRDLKALLATRGLDLDQLGLTEDVFGSAHTQIREALRLFARSLIAELKKLDVERSGNDVSEKKRLERLKLNPSPPPITICPQILPNAPAL